MHDETVNNGDEQTDADSADTSPRHWSSQELLAGQVEAIIVHAGEVYRLRCTRNNKLILTK